MSSYLSRLRCVKTNTDRSIQCQCPACFASGGDSKGEHLRVYPSGAYSCVVHPDSKDHNRAIKAYLKGLTINGDDIDLDYEVIDPEPKLNTPKVYPESILTKLLPDHSYWINRGIKPEVMVQMGGGLATTEEKSKLSGRYILPCKSYENQLIGFVGRWVGKENTFAPKYKIIGKKSHFCFPSMSLSDYAIRSTGEVILVESQGCSLSLASAGLWQSKTLFGLKVSSKLLS